MCGKCMSANDWLKCPVCHGLPFKVKNGYKQFYGKVPEEEYFKLKREYESSINIERVRVDYEYEIKPNGIIILSFFAECEACDAKWEHKGEVMKS